LKPTVTLQEYKDIGTIAVNIAIIGANRNYYIFRISFPARRGSALIPTLLNTVLRLVVGITLLIYNCDWRQATLFCN
jgi:hypothetical protein